MAIANILIENAFLTGDYALSVLTGEKKNDHTRNRAGRGVTAFGDIGYLCGNGFPAAMLKSRACRGSRLESRPNSLGQKTASMKDG